MADDVRAQPVFDLIAVENRRVRLLNNLPPLSRYKPEIEEMERAGTLVLEIERALVHQVGPAEELLSPFELYRGATGFDGELRVWVQPQDDEDQTGVVIAVQLFKPTP